MPISDVTITATDNAIWNFPAQEAKYIKILFTKIGYDFIDKRSYIYEFGAESIAFFLETYNEDSSSELISNTLSVFDIDNNLTEFNKITLDVCERVPTNTDIQYYVSALT